METAAPAEGAEETMNWDEDDEETESLKKTSAAQQAYNDAIEAERIKNAKRCGASPTHRAVTAGVAGLPVLGSRKLHQSLLG